MCTGIVICVLLFATTCAMLDRNGTSANHQWDLRRLRFDQWKSHSLPDLRLRNGDGSLSRQPLRQTIRRFASQLLIRRKRGSGGERENCENSSTGHLATPNSSTWKRSLERLKTMFSQSPQDLTTLHVPASSEDTSPASSGSGRQNSNHDPFQRGVPHTVGVLINTIYSGTNIRPSVVRGVFRLAPLSKAVDEGMADLSTFESEMPNAHRRRQKRTAALYLTRWFRQHAADGHPLLPDYVVELVMFTHGSILSGADLLDAGRQQTLYALRDLMRWLAFMQRDLPAHESVTLDGLAALLTPSLVNPSYLVSNARIRYRLCFLPKFYCWLQTSV